MLSTVQAAQLLAVSPERVRALVATGQLDGSRVGGRWVVSAEAVEQRRESAAAPVRPMSARVAWAAAALLDGKAVPWLSQPEASRLRRRMRTAGADPATWRAWLRRRATGVERLAITEAYLGLLLADERVAVTGVRAARTYGVDLASAGEAEVYVGSATDLSALRRAYGLVASAAPNATVRIADGPWRETLAPAGGARVVPSLVVAADLLDAADSRSRRAGTELLRRTVDALGG
jgi:excisionase family DNA binding protein